MGGRRLFNPFPRRDAFHIFSFGPARAPVGGVGRPWGRGAGAPPLSPPRHSIARQSGAASANAQTAMTNRLMLWGFPAFAVVGGPFLPLAILIYWLANNAWTLGQQYVVFRRIDREQQDAEATDESGPAVGTADGPDEVPGVIEDRSRDEDQPGTAR